MSSISSSDYRPTSPFIEVISLEKQPPKSFLGSPKYSVIRKQFATKTSSSTDFSEIETKLVVAENIYSEQDALILTDLAVKTFKASYVASETPIAIPVRVRSDNGSAQIVGVVFSPNRVKIIPLANETSIVEQMENLAKKNNGVAIVPT